MELLQVHVVGKIAVDKNVLGVVEVWVWMEQMKVYVLVMILSLDDFFGEVCKNGGAVVEGI